MRHVESRISIREAEHNSAINRVRQEQSEERMKLEERLSVMSSQMRMFQSIDGRLNKMVGESEARVVARMDQLVSQRELSDVENAVQARIQGITSRLADAEARSNSLLKAKHAEMEMFVNERVQRAFKDASIIDKTVMKVEDILAGT